MSVLLYTNCQRTTKRWVSRFSSAITNANQGYNAQSTSGFVIAGPQHIVAR